MCSGTFLSVIVGLLFLVSFGEGTPKEDFCTDVSFWDVIKYTSYTAKCCDTIVQEECISKAEQVCAEATEIKCKTIGWAECTTKIWPTEGKKCHVTHKDFPYRNCKEEKFTVKHTKKVPKCKTVIKEYCVTDWTLDSYGNKVWGGTEKCEPISWEECDIVETPVDFPAVKTNCDIVSNIKWADFVQGITEVVEMKQTCEVKSALNCVPVLVNNCVEVRYTECEMKAQDSCYYNNIYEPSQEKIHQKKCLTGTSGLQPQPSCVCGLVKPKLGCQQIPVKDCSNDGKCTTIIQEQCIVGGEETEPHMYPWQVGLINSSTPFCGGSLISSNTVLTAAHCTDGRSTGDLRVLVGEHDTTIQDGEFKVNVKQIIEHPDYDSSTTDNDFALLILEKSVEWTESVQPVCLPAKSSSDYENIEAIVSGWGRTSSGGQLSTTLQEVKVDTMTNGECTSHETLYEPGRITSSMICAAEKQGNGGKDTCQGDSGGPLIAKESGESYSQIGVVSWGIGCARADAPGVYSRVTEKLKWIQDNMQGTTCPAL